MRNDDAKARAGNGMDIPTPWGGFHVTGVVTIMVLLTLILELTLLWQAEMASRQHRDIVDTQREVIYMHRELINSMDDNFLAQVIPPEQREGLIDSPFLRKRLELRLQKRTQERVDRLTTPDRGSTRKE